jgi:hypothetical protein
MTFDLPGFFRDSNCSYYIFYQSMILLSLVISYVLYRGGIKRIVFLVFLLLLTLLVEVSADVLIGFAWIYHVFNLFEYTLLCLYYSKNSNVKTYTNWVHWSIPLFLIFGIASSYFLYHFRSLPALNINIEGLFLFVIYSHLLFNLDTNIDIFTHHDFWISIGVLTYFGGVFVFFSLYHTLLNLDHKHAVKLFIAITIPLNIILYICITISQICLMRKKKYFM